MKTYYFKTWFILACLTVLTCTVSCSKEDSQEDIEKQESLSVTDEILELVNIHRAGIGMDALVSNKLATQLAYDHTLFMVSEGEISHENFDDRAQRLFDEENAIGSGENVAKRLNSPEAVVEGWLNSAPHRKNIENDFTHIGISAIKDAVGDYYYTQLFLKQ